MLGLIFSLPAALNLLWALVSDKGVDALHNQIETHTRARQVAKISADCIGRAIPGGTVDVGKLKQIVLSQDFADWLRTGSEQDARLVDSLLNKLVGKDEIVRDRVRHEIASCVIESFEAVVAKDLRVAMILGTIRKANGKLYDEIARNSNVLAERLDTLDTAVQSSSHAVIQTLADMNRRLDAMRDDQAMLLEIAKDVRKNLAEFRVSYQAEIQQYDQTHKTVLERDADIRRVLERLGEIGARYLVIEGPAWAGKTAFVVLLRRMLVAAGWRTIIYFWREGQSDIDHFLDVVNTQLLEMLDIQSGVPLRLAEKRAQFNALWERAIAEPRPLALIVDGFDEQPEDFPLVKLVPRTFGLSGRVILSTRPQPDLLTEVDPTHPLAHTDYTVRVQLGTSPYATVQQRQAERATRHLLDKEPLIAGLLAVAPELSAEEIGELVGGARTPGQIRNGLAGSARHLERSTDSCGVERLRWAHIELLREVNAWFGTARRRDLVQKVADWCDEYRARGWPPDTPEWCLRHLDTFVRRERVDPFRWLEPERRERMVRALLHLGPYLYGIHTADGELRKDGHVEPRLDLAAEYLDAVDRALELPRSVYLALRLVGREHAAREAAEESPDSWAAPWLSVEEPPSVPQVPAHWIADQAQEMVDKINRQVDPFERLGSPVKDGKDLCDWFVALAWHVANSPYEGLRQRERGELTGKLVGEALATALGMPVVTGLAVLEDVVRELAVPQVELAVSIASRHPERSRVALSLAEEQDSRLSHGVKLRSAVPNFPRRPVPPAEAEAAFRLIAPLVDNDPRSLAYLCDKVVRWAPRQAAELAMLFVSSDQGLDPRESPYGLVRALALVDPARARRLLETYPALNQDKAVGGRLLALGVVDDPERFETALQEAVHWFDGEEQVTVRDWILSDAIDLLALRNASRALAIFDELHTGKYIGFATSYLTHKLDPGNSALPRIADRVEQVIDDTRGQDEVLVRFGLGAVSLVDPWRALQILERWSITDHMHTYPGYEAVGRLALSDLDAAFEYLRHFKYPWHGQEAIARHLAGTDPESSLQLCADIPFPDIRAVTRARVASVSQSEKIAQPGFAGALDAFMVATDRNGEEILAVIVGSLATSELSYYRNAGVRAVGRLCDRWAEPDNQDPI